MVQATTQKTSDVVVVEVAANATGFAAVQEILPETTAVPDTHRQAIGNQTEVNLQQDYMLYMLRMAGEIETL